MYVIIEKDSEFPYVYKYATDVVDLIGCNPKTVYRHKDEAKWIYKDFIVYNCLTKNVKIKSRNKGGKSHFR